jgi:hypothetical protein
VLPADDRLVGEDSSEPWCWLALGQVYTCTATCSRQHFSISKRAGRY